MGCYDCFRKFFNSVLTIVSLGLVTGICGAAFGMLSMDAFADIGSPFDTLKTVFLIALCISGALLLFAIYASCCGGKIANMILGIIFLVFGLVLLAAAIVIWVMVSTLIDKLAKMWTEPGNEAYVLQLEALFKCSGWTEGEDPCKDKVDSMVDQWVTIICAVLLIVAICMLIGTTLSFCYGRCHKEEISDETKFEQAIAYA